ncbi:MAG: hypothetical protein IJ597_05655 [Synergistaceae bacterium]|nr:hypothetical protein [Synergistaceae bacterium]
MNKNNEVPERSAISSESKWNLEAIYENFDAWQNAYDKTREKIKELKNYAGKLKDGSKTLLAFIKDDEAVSLELNKLYVYANMKSHEDLREAKPMELAGLAENLMVKYSEAVAFFEPEILSLPHDYINDCIKNEHELTRYEFFFRKLLREREHILSSEIERILAKASDLIKTP